MDRKYWIHLFYPSILIYGQKRRSITKKMIYGRYIWYEEKRYLDARKKYDIWWKKWKRWSRVRHCFFFAAAPTPKFNKKERNKGWYWIYSDIGFTLILGLLSLNFRYWIYSDIFRGKMAVVAYLPQLPFIFFRHTRPTDPSSGPRIAGLGAGLFHGFQIFRLQGLCPRKKYNT